MSARQPATRLRVLQSVASPGPTIKFIDQIVRHAPDDIEFTFFSWRAALTGNYDVFHVHWPEFLLRHGSRSGTLLRQSLFKLLLIRLKRSKTRIVRTVHNIEPHDASSPREKELLAQLDSLVSTYVVMSDCTPTTPPDRTVLIPHGDYREAFAHLEKSSIVKGRILVFGRLHPYKGVIEFLRAAELVADKDVEIRIVGSPTEQMREEIEAELANPSRTGPRVTTELRAVSNEEMVTEITQAELIALPYQDAGNGNSGVALVALSLNRPIVTPRSCVMLRLAEEVGDNWVHMSDHVLQASDIESALESTRKRAPGTGPTFARRDWQSVAQSYAETFRAN